MFSLETFQREVGEWTEKNFCPHPPHHPLLGIIEEVGELAHAHLKDEQGIRGTPEEHREEAVDAIGDIVIFLADYCCVNDFDLEACIDETWQKVRERRWKNG
jgi:NTP pyrophosphatase (non-canonical NTP hydrolase)